MQLRFTFCTALLFNFFLSTYAQNWVNGGNSLSANGALGTLSNHALIFRTANEDRGRITNTGNWGIGTTNPLTRFHVNGFGAFGNRVTAANASRALNLADTAAVMRILRVHASFAPAVELISRTSADGPNIAYWDFYAEPADASFRIRDRVRGGSGLDRLTIGGSNGFVGINTTAPLTRFHVNGFGSFGNRVTNESATRALNLIDDNAVMRVLRVHPTNAPAVELISRANVEGENVAYWDFYAEPSDKSFRIRDRVTGANLDRITISNPHGFVGVGTTTPQHRLHVEGASNHAIFVSTTNPGAASGSGTIAYMKGLPTAAGNRLGFSLFGSRGGAEFSYNTAGMSAFAGDAWTAGASHPSYLSFETTAPGTVTRAERMRINPEGNVGVGTTSPHASALLDLTSTTKGMLTPRMTLAQRNTITSPAQGLLVFQTDNTPGFYYYDGEWKTFTNPNLFTGTINTTKLNVSGDPKNGINAAIDLQGVPFLSKGPGAVIYRSSELVDAQNTFLGVDVATSVFAYYEQEYSVGMRNTAAGYQALYNLTEGNENTAVGTKALYNNSDGYYNTAVGVQALESNHTGSSNTGLGHAADISDGLTNATAVGANAYVDASNKVRIGSSWVTSIGGQVGWTVFSDGRYKRNIKEDVPGLAFINTLRPVSYSVNVQGLREYYRKGRKQLDSYSRQTTNNDKVQAAIQQGEEIAGSIIYSGFVAQEVEEAAKKLKYEFSGVDKPQTEGGLYGLRYSDFVVPLVKAVQELDAKTKEIDELKNELAELKQLVSKLAGGQTINTSLTGGSLLQNAPNPVRGTTSIQYSLPEGSSRAQLLLTDALGRTIKVIQLTSSGVVNVDVSALSSGLYNYSLVVDGKTLQTKKMTVKR
jgi:hypothetical protein